MGRDSDVRLFEATRRGMKRDDADGEGPQRSGKPTERVYLIGTEEFFLSLKKKQSLLSSGSESNLYPDIGRGRFGL